MLDEKLDQPSQDTPPPEYVGGPGQDQPQEEQTPESSPSVKRVKYNGKELEVPEDVASVWEEREREFSRRLSEQGTELGQLRRQVQSITASQQPSQQPQQPKGADYSTLVWEDPNKAFNQFGTDLETRIYNRMRTEYIQEQNQRQYWDYFYQTNPDLKADKHGWVVQAVLQENWSDLENLHPKEAASRLADRTREAIRALAGETSAGDKKVLPQGRAQVEGGSGTGAPPTPKPAPGPNSISDILKQRRQARRSGK